MGQCPTGDASGGCSLSLHPAPSLPHWLPPVMLGQPTSFLRPCVPGSTHTHACLSHRRPRGPGDKAEPGAAGRGPTSPPGGDPGEERTLSPRNTTASRSTPVCPPDSPPGSRRGHTPVRCCERRQLGLPRLRLRRVLQDPLHLLLDLPGPQQPAIMVEPDLEVAAPVEDDDVLAVPQVLDGVCGGRGQASRGTWLENARTHPRRHLLLSPRHSAPLSPPAEGSGLWAGTGLGAGSAWPPRGRVTQAKGHNPPWARVPAGGGRS